MNLDQLTDSQIGDFVLHDMIGRRAAMVLYRATQQSLKRFVVVKVIELKSVPVQKDALEEDFLAFTRRVVTLEFMHLQPIYDFGIVDDDYLFIAARFMAGDLHELLQTGALPLDRTLELTMQIMQAVVFIHAQDMVHSSLTPHNVYIDEAHNAYIDDLELSRLVQAARTPTELQLLLDEPFYMSVEQMQLKKPDFRSEMYSVGAIIYHMLTGVAPFSDGEIDFDSVLQRKLLNQVIPIRRFNPALPAALEKIVLRTLRANPAERFPDIKALEKALSQQVKELTPGGSVLSRVQDLFGRLRPGS
ncbi:MAG: serine/threonine-protein kinase [Chloroflexota bacterium]